MAAKLSPANVQPAQWAILHLVVHRHGDQGAVVAVTSTANVAIPTDSGMVWSDIVTVTERPSFRDVTVYTGCRSYLLRFLQASSCLGQHTAMGLPLA